MRSTTWSVVDKHIDSNKLYEDLIVIFANDMFSSMKISAAWQVIAPSESSLRVIAPNASPRLEQTQLYSSSEGNNAEHRDFLPQDCSSGQRSLFSFRTGVRMRPS